MLGAVIGLVSAAPAAAKPAAQTWQSEDLDAGVVGAVTSAGPGRTVVVTTGPAPEYKAVARVRGGDGRLGEAQELAPNAWSAALDGSAEGGAVAAFDGPVIAELLPGADGFTFVPGLPDRLHSPKVAVGDDGSAVVAFVESSADDSRVVAISRDAPGGFGPPVAVTGWQSGVEVADVALGADGSALVAYFADDARRVATRSADGSWSSSEPLGGPLAGPWYDVLAAGVDGRGAVVAAWTEGVSEDTNAFSPVSIAFRAPGVTAFGAPRALDMLADPTKFGLGVSRAGEVLVYGGHVQWGYGVYAAFGSTYGERIGPVGMLDRWGTYPALAMNDRGDAMIAWDGPETGRIQTRVRRAGESFGPLSEPQAPGGDSAWPLSADLDPLGNAQLLWRFNEGGGRLAVDGPLRTEAAEPAAATGELPDLLYMDIYEEAGIWMPGRPYGDYYPPYIGPAPAADKGAPAVTLAALKVKPGARRLAMKVRCSERCAVRARAYRGKRAGKVARASLAARVQRRVRVALPRGSGKLRVRVSVRDAAGNSRTVSRRVRTAR